MGGRQREKPLAGLVAEAALGSGIREPVAAEFYKLLLYDDRQGAVLEPDGLCRALAGAPGLALQPKRRPHHRKALSDPLGLAGAFREEARALGGEGEPAPGAGGDPALERGLEMLPVRRHWRSPDHGES